MRHFVGCLLVTCAGAAGAQVGPTDTLPLPDLDLLQAGPAWLVGDHVKARRHFRAAALRAHPLGQYNLAMMLLYREGGPCDVAQAAMLLRKSADAGVGLAREALEQMHARELANQRPHRQFACPADVAGPRAVKRLAQRVPGPGTRP